MSWKDLLAKHDDRVVLPWLGGRTLYGPTRTWAIQGQLPREHGWYSFEILGRQAGDPRPADPQPEILQKHNLTGYLVGNRFAADAFAHRVVIGLVDIARELPRVHLIEDGLDRFTRVRVGSLSSSVEAIIYVSREMPLGPEDDVMRAFEDRTDTVANIKGVTPALDAAFRMESFQRAEAERRRAELERLRREEEERLAAEERRRELVKQLGDGVGRRALAKLDFEQAAKAALHVGGAELLSWKKGRGDEYVVRYRLDGDRFECVCDDNLRIIDAGICLVDHRTGQKGDTRFTLESLPAVVRQAERDDVLVVFRHV